MSRSCSENSAPENGLLRTPAALSRFLSAPSEPSIERAARALHRLFETRQRAPLAVCCDFDGTIALPDLCNATLETFGKPEWIEVEKRWIGGEIPSQEALRLQFATVEATPSALHAFYERAGVAEGFVEFVHELRRTGTPILALSDGLDLYIRQVLARLRLEDLPYVANHAECARGGIEIAFPHRDTACRQCGACKCAYVLALRRRADHIVYVGDGLSDCCASAHADVVYAKDRLLDALRSLGRPFREFAGFRALARDLAAGRHAEQAGPAPR